MRKPPKKTMTFALFPGCFRLGAGVVQHSIEHGRGRGRMVSATLPGWPNFLVDQRPSRPYHHEAFRALFSHRRGFRERQT